MKCRNCGKELVEEFVDLGFSPPSNSILTKSDLNRPEVYYPLKVFMCNNCFLVQTLDFHKGDELFTGKYPYFSAFSATWKTHCKEYVSRIEDYKKDFTTNSTIVELGSGDGTLLDAFKEKGYKNIYGIDPSGSVASVAEFRGLRTFQEFFSENTAKELQNNYGIHADLVVGNNVLAHVPDINDFVRGIAVLLNDTGLLTVEFPSIDNLIKTTAFDTIYHEHYSYLSLTAIKDIFEQNGLYIIDIDRLETHGGSLRVYAVKSTNLTNEEPLSYYERCDKIAYQIEVEKEYLSTKKFKDFQEKVTLIKDEALKFLYKAKEENKKVVAFGAAAKGVTFLNYCGINNYLLPCVGDETPAKIGRFLPGSHIPIVSLQEMVDVNPDYVIILAWNWETEIISKLSPKLPNTKFVKFIPGLTIMETLNHEKGK